MTSDDKSSCNSSGKKINDLNFRKTANTQVGGFTPAKKDNVAGVGIATPQKPLKVDKGK